MLPKNTLLFSALLVSTLLGCTNNDNPPAPDPEPEPDTEFTISGTFLPVQGAVVDSDVNDPNQTETPNNSFANAQEISAPTSFGGFVGSAQATDAGRFEGIGDMNDYYHTYLLAGQIIVVSIEDNTEHDVDLHLYASDETLIDASLGLDRAEWLEVTEDGEYYIRISVGTGQLLSSTSTSYLLTIGELASTQHLPRTLKVSQQFMPGDALVTPKNTLSTPSVFSQRKLRRQKIATSTPDPYGLDYLGGNYTEQKLATLEKIKELHGRDDIERAEPNYIYFTQLVPNDRRYPAQWHYPLINLPNAWDITTGSADTIVAVIDTGVLLAHPDLSGRMVPGYDFIADADNAGDGDGIDDNPNDNGDFAMIASSSFHGTHVAGTIAANSNNLTGVAGVDWQARIMPMRALGRLGGSGYDIEQAMRYAAGMENDSGTVPDNPADIINMSLGGPDFSQGTADLIDEIRDLGIIVIAAAGNDGTDQVNYPAGHDGVVSVASVTIDKSRADYSNFGSTVDIAAPGGNASTDINGDGFGDGVLSTLGEDSSFSSNVRSVYGFYEGTSMAAPHVAGVAALMKSVFPTMTPAQFDALISSGNITEDLGDTGRDNLFGWGMIDAVKALNAAIEANGGNVPEPQPVLIISPGQINFGTVLSTVRLTASAGSSADVSVTSVTETSDWLTISSPSSENGLGDYVFTVDRENLQDGSYQTSVVFASAAGDVTVPVLVQVSSEQAPADSGYHYVLIVDPDTDTALYQAEAAAVDGQYTFEFEDIPAGSYTLYAGTDLDNDDFICDYGEACGAYRILERPITIELSGDLTGLQFNTKFSAAIADNDAFSTRELWKTKTRAIKRQQ